MKSLTTLLFFLAFSPLLIGQASGNVNYQNNTRLPEQNINVNFQGSDIIIDVKGMNNVKADAYIAIFSLTQIAEKADQTNDLMEDRINAVRKAIQNQPKVTSFVDMVSFVPFYDYEVEKRTFRRDTYQEVPKGFELKKNLHIQFSNPDFLNNLVKICAQNGIYDLVRVDYTCVHMEDQKKELRNRAKEVIKEKMAYYEAISGLALDSLDKEIVDGFRVLYPIEQYKSYQAYSSSGTSLTIQKNKKSNKVEKATTYYYQPIIDKEFDFVINPIVVEPAIQVIYQVKLKVKRKAKPQPQKVQKEYMLILPSGEVKKLEID